MTSRKIHRWISRAYFFMKLECPFQLSNEETAFSGRWIKTRKVRFKCRDGAEGVWESAHRVTRPESAEVDGVDIIVVLKKCGKKFFVFVKQYRIPMNGWCLEFPAGLIDKGETVESAALRELKEETGYVAQSSDIVHKTSGIQGLDPGLTDDSIQFVTVHVDGDCPQNQNPKQQLESSESIEVVLVECDQVLEYLRSIEKQIHIEAMVYSFAIGYSVMNKLKL